MSPQPQASLYLPSPHPSPKKILLSPITFRPPLKPSSTLNHNKHGPSPIHSSPPSNKIISKDRTTHKRDVDVIDLAGFEDEDNLKAGVEGGMDGIGKEGMGFMSPELQEILNGLRERRKEAGLETKADLNAKIEKHINQPGKHGMHIFGPPLPRQTFSSYTSDTLKPQTNIATIKTSNPVNNPNSQLQPPINKPSLPIPQQTTNHLPLTTKRRRPTSSSDITLYNPDPATTDILSETAYEDDEASEYEGATKRVKRYWVETFGLKKASPKKIGLKSSLGNGFNGERKRKAKTPICLPVLTRGRKWMGRVVVDDEDDDEGGAMEVDIEGMVARAERLEGKEKTNNKEKLERVKNWVLGKGEEEVMDMEELKRMEGASERFEKSLNAILDEALGEDGDEDVFFTPKAFPDM